MSRVPSRFTPVALTIAVLMAGATVAKASPILDPLHGFCGTNANTSACVDNGTVTPADPSQVAGGFGFYASPAPSGLLGTDWIIAVLVPDTIIGSGTQTFTVSETATTHNPARVNVPMTMAGDWTSGDLAAFLSIPNSSPSNPLAAFQVGLNTSASGFHVYWADLGSADLADSSGSILPAVPILTLGGSPLLAGIDITAFLEGTNQPHSTVATAPSGVIQITKNQLLPVPEPASILLLGSGVVAALRRRRLA